MTPQDAAVVEMARQDPDLGRRVVLFVLQDVQHGDRATFLFRRVPYTKGFCFSCGEAIARFEFGRCPRCCVAWRLAIETPVSAAAAQVRDAVRMCG